MRNKSKSEKLLNLQNKNPNNIQTEIQQEIILGKDHFYLEKVYLSGLSLFQIPNYFEF
jgi:hypothetical protein